MLSKLEKINLFDKNVLSKISVIGVIAFIAWGLYFASQVYTVNDKASEVQQEIETKTALLEKLNSGIENGNLIGKMNTDYFTRNQKFILNHDYGLNVDRVDRELKEDFRSFRQDIKGSQVKSVFRNINSLYSKALAPLQRRNFRQQTRLESVVEKFRAQSQIGKVSELEFLSSSIQRDQEFIDYMVSSGVPRRLKARTIEKIENIVEHKEELLNSFREAQAYDSSLTRYEKKFSEVGRTLSIELGGLSRQLNQLRETSVRTVVQASVAFSAIVFFLAGYLVFSFQRRTGKIKSKKIRALRKRERKLKKNKEIMSVVQNLSPNPLVVINPQDQVVWSNKEFKNILAPTDADKISSLRWKELFARNFIDTYTESKIKGSVKLKKNMADDFVVRSKVSSTDSNSYRVLEVLPLHSYITEIAKGDSSIRAPQGFSSDNYSELNDILKSLSLNTLDLEQKLNVPVNVKETVPKLVSFPEKLLKKEMGELVAGVSRFLRFTGNTSKIEFSAFKDDGQFMVSVEAHGAEVDAMNSSRTIRLDNVKYPSLVETMATYEKRLIEHGGHVVVKNKKYAKGQKSIVFEFSIQEEERPQPSPTRETNHAAHMHRFNEQMLKERSM